MSADRQHPQDDRQPDGFEARLARQPLRAAPLDLRAQVLNAAQAAQKPVQATPQKSEAPTNWWNWMLLRFPLATGGLAACWLFIWVGRSVDQWANGGTPTPSVEISATQVAEARAQREALFQFASSELSLDRSAPPLRKRHRLEAPGQPTRPRGDRRRDREDHFGLLPEDVTQQVARTETHPSGTFRTSV